MEGILVFKLPFWTKKFLYFITGQSPSRLGDRLGSKWFGTMTLTVGR